MSRCIERWPRESIAPPANDHTEVLVVGAGPVGLLTVLLLTQHGVRARIIEAESRTAAHSYACALHPASLGLLERVGLADEVIELGRRVETVSLYEGHVPRAHLKLSDLAGRYPFAVVLEQSVLEDLLEQQLRRAGSKVEWNHRLLEIKPSENGVEARVKKLVSPGRNLSLREAKTGLEDCVTIHGDFVVGADGHNSTVRRQLNIRSICVGAPQLFGVYEIEKTEEVDRVMKLVLDKSGNGVFWPLANDRCRWSFQLAPAEAGGEFPRKERNRLISERTRGELDAIRELRDFLAERAPWFPIESIVELNWMAIVQFQRQVARRFGQGRCWLAGDAAHQTSPAGMQSMNLGLLEGADLADRFKSILRDRAGLEVLQTYNRIHGAEWRRLLGLKVPTEPPDSLFSWASWQFSTILGIKPDAKLRRSFPPWACRHSGSILSGIPASGEDLERLLQQL